MDCMGLEGVLTPGAGALLSLGGVGSVEAGDVAAGIMAGVAEAGDT